MRRNQNLFVRYAVALGLLLAAAAGFYLCRPRIAARVSTISATVTEMPASGLDSISKRFRSSTLQSGHTAFWRAFTQLIETVEAESGVMRSEKQAMAVQEAVDQISFDCLPGAFNEAGEVQSARPTETGRELQWRIIQRWAERDVVSAAEALNDMRMDDRGEFYERVARVWARAGLSDAISWARQIAETDDRGRALAAIAAEKADSDPITALSLIAAMPLGEVRNQVISRAITAWASAAPEQAADWVKQIPDPSARAEATVSWAIASSDEDPRAAAKFVIETLPPGSQRDSALAGIVQHWAVQDPGFAAECMDQFPEGKLRDTAAYCLSRLSMH